MAQWRRQFTGNTHETKIEDVEDSLHEAIASFRSAEAKDREQKAKAVRNLAERLLTVRLKLLKARLAALIPAAEEREQDAKRISSLNAREAKARNDGVAGLLKEFRVFEAIE